MNLKLTALLAVIVVALLTTMSANAQPVSSQLWLHITDDASPADTLTLFYGNWPGATYCFDSTLTTAWVEQELPPAPPFPVPFSAYFTAPQSRFATCFGNGTLPVCFYPFPTNPTQKDTFKIYIKNDNAPSANWTFSWSDAADMAHRVDSAFIQYLDPTNGLIKTNMLTNNNVVVSAPGDNAITLLTIYKYGAKVFDMDTLRKADAVKQVSSQVPSTFALHQNYPNPFNPTTTIAYDVQKMSNIDIAVYNLLGQRVATLASGDMAPGSYSATWNGATDRNISVSSGVYYVRMVAKTLGSQNSEQFSALRKLLLMK